MAGSDSLCEAPGSGHLGPYFIDQSDAENAVTGDKSIDTDGTRAASQQRRRVAGSSSISTDATRGLDSHCVVQGSGQLSQPVNSVHATRMASQAEGRRSCQAQPRPKRGLTGAEKVWVVETFTSRYGNPSSLRRRDARCVWECGIQSGALAQETKLMSVLGVLRRKHSCQAQPRPRRGLRVEEKRWVLHTLNSTYPILKRRDMRSIWACGMQSGHLAPDTKFESVRSVLRRQPQRQAHAGYRHGLTGTEKLWVLCAVEARYGTTTSLRLRDMRSIWELGIQSGYLAPYAKLESVRSVLRRALKINGSDI